MGEPSARGDIVIDIGESVGQYRVRLTFDVVERVETTLATFAELQRSILSYRFGIVDAYTLVRAAIHATPQDRPLPPDEVLKEAFASMGLVRATELCTPIVALAFNGTEDHPELLEPVEGGEEGGGDPKAGGSPPGHSTARH